MGFALISAREVPGFWWGVNLIALGKKRHLLILPAGSLSSQVSFIGLFSNLESIGW